MEEGHLHRPGTGNVARLLLAFTLISVMTSACGEEEFPPQVKQDAEIYEAALNHLVEVSGVELAENWVDPVVFVEVLDTTEVDLETQVAVVDEMDEEFAIRFVDDLGEAVDIELDDLPVREGTILIAFGPIEVDGAEYRFHAEYYIDSDESLGLSFRFENRQPAGADRPRMVLIGEPVEVPTELVVVRP